MTDTTNTELRKIFEKHTIPEEGDPELLMFDTDAIITAIEAYVAQREKVAYEKGVQDGKAN